MMIMMMMIMMPGSDDDDDDDDDFKLKEFQNASFLFSCGKKHFESGAFRKR